jgi:uncharacterized protein YbgA (DUF1722 family)
MCLVMLWGEPPTGLLSVHFKQAFTMAAESNKHTHVLLPCEAYFKQHLHNGEQQQQRQ